jgi:uncharacterized protein (TIGR03435 family)
MNRVPKLGLVPLLFAASAFVCFGRADDKRPHFEVASIKPMKSIPDRIFFGMMPGGRFSANGMTIKFLIQAAYGLKEAQLSGVPAWADSERFDVEAKADEETAAIVDKLSREQRNQQLMLMLQGMLADRCKLEVEHEKKELPVYALLVAKNGPKLQPSTASAEKSTGTAGMAGPRMTMNGRGNLTATFVDMDALANALSRPAGRPIINKTGLTGHYDCTLKWLPDDVQSNQGGPKASSDDGADSSGPSLFTALQEQLGLKLEAEKAPMDFIVIRHLERPSEN